MEDTDLDDPSKSEKIGWIEGALDQADWTEPTRGPRAGILPQFIGEVRLYLGLTEGGYVETKTVFKIKQGDDWDQ